LLIQYIIVPDLFTGFIKNALIVVGESGDVEGVEDPAEVISIALRHTLRSMPEDPLCAWFIFRYLGFSDVRVHDQSWVSYCAVN